MVRSVKNALILIFFITTIILIHSLAHPWISWVIDASTLLTLLAVNSAELQRKREMKKMARTNDILCFALKFTLRLQIIVAIANWPFFPLPNSTNSPSSPVK